MLVQVPPLELPAVLLPCERGTTLDLRTAVLRARPSWTSCEACPAEQVGLWKDSRPSLQALQRNDFETYMRQYAEFEPKAACQNCPQGAFCELQFIACKRRFTCALQSAFASMGYEHTYTCALNAMQAKVDV